MQLRNTPKQREIMNHVCLAIAKGEKITSAQLHQQLSYGASASRPAVLCSVAYLEQHGLLTKEKAGRNVYLTPTARGFALYGPKL